MISRSFIEETISFGYNLFHFNFIEYNHFMYSNGVQSVDLSEKTKQKDKN